MKLTKYDLQSIQQLKASGTTYDKIFANLMYGEKYVKLAPVEIKQMERYKYAYNCMINGRSPDQIVRLLERVFGVKMTTAYNDIRESKKLYGDIWESDKKAERQLAYQRAQTTWRLAKQSGDIKEMNRAEGNMIKLLGLDRDDPNLPDFSKLGNNNYYMVFQVVDKKVKLNLNRLEEFDQDERLNVLDTVDAEIVEEDTKMLDDYADGRSEQTDL